jgi:pyruvate kinase
MKRARKVKILATLGPSSGTKEQIRALHEAGADVFRINMSHTSHDKLAELVAAIRAVEAECGRPIGILGDLQGPKLRLGSFQNGSIDLQAGDSFQLDSDSTPGNTERVHLPHPEILEALEIGHALLLDDGKVRLRVVGCDGKSTQTVVEAGTKLSDRKGVSCPDTTLAVSAMTEKDHADLDAALAQNVDWIALSFVQRKEDIAEARAIVQGRAGIMTKIEKPQAIQNFEEILALSDSIMVARGDLGVEMPLEQVPGIQKRITRAARGVGKPVVVATQMLESMITAPVPTRAEVSDVATAVYEGADAIMLSAESAAGDYPVEAVTTMNAIAEEVEIDPNYENIIYSQHTEPVPTASDAISAATRQIAKTLELGAIVCYTSSGTTAQRVSRERPMTPIIALSPILKTARRSSLVWGLHCVVSDDASDLDEMVDRACRIAYQEGFVGTAERVIITAGVPLGTPGATNMLRIAYVDGSKAD